MALTRYGDIQFRYNTQETVELKEVPIIGNEIPNANHKNFDESTSIVCAGGAGVTSELDKRRAYKSTACFKVSMGAAASSTTLTWTPSAAVNFRQHRAAEVNKYASVSKTGKYLSGGTSFKDSFVFVLNLAYYQATADASGSFTVEAYSGTKKAATDNQYLASHGVYYRDTYQFRMTADDWTYSVGFADADWDAITKVVISFTKSDYDTYFYVHNIASALPKYSADITDSYYPEITEANSIFISQLFGSDSNAGTRSAPVKTIERALALIDAAAADFVNAVIMDSETYKPFAADYSYAGIKQTLDRNTTIIADYLETPKISAEPGLTSEIRVGARDNYRSRWYTGTTAATYYVAKTGNDGTGTAGDITKPYLTIQAALTAASNNGYCIEIIDSGTYDEVVTANFAVTIQAAPGCKPVMKKTGGNTVLDMNSQGVVVYGITFQGNSAASAQIIKTGTTASGQNITDCTFTAIGTSSGTATAIYYGATNNGALTVENCLFINNGENFIAIEDVSSVKGLVKISNCIGNMGATANNYFVKNGKAGSSAITAVITNSRILGISDTSLSFIAHISDSGAATAGSSNIYMFFNESNLFVQTNSTYSIIGAVKIYNNYFHDNTQTTGVSFIEEVYSASTMSIDVKGNVFENIVMLASEYVIKQVHATGSINNNCFFGCARCIEAVDGNNYDYNLFINGTQVQYYHYVDGADTLTGCVFYDCLYSVVTNNAYGTPNLTVTNSIRYNSEITQGAGTTLTFAGSLEDPGFIDVDKKNISWYRGYIIENSTTNYRQWLSDFIYPSGAYDLSIKFVDLYGYTGQIINTAAAHIKPMYCYVHDFTVGLNSVSGQVSPQYCLFENNGIAVRYNNSTIATAPDCKYNIFDGNNTGILLKSGATIDHCTVINGDYGIVGVFSGFYAIDDYISDYLSISNTIIFDNAVYDYYYNLPTDYCIIGTRYYDMLASTHVDYKNTVGAHDVTENPVLTDDYFPALKIMGYKYNSPAYMSASDGVSNIGARYVNRIYAAMSYDYYTIAANPQEYSFKLVPVNLESSIDTEGGYEAESDADMTQIAFTWTEPGRLSKIKSVQKTAMQYIYQTYWVVGISLDAGATWTYYKVNKETNPQTKQIGFYYSELPWGEWTMEFNKMPDSFVIAEYTVNTMEA